MATAAAAVADSRESGCCQRLSSTSTYMTTAVDGYRRSWDGLGTMSLAASSESGSRRSRDGLGTVMSLAAHIDSGGVGSRCSRDGLGTVPLATSSESGSWTVWGPSPWQLPPRVDPDAAGMVWAP